MVSNQSVFSTLEAKETSSEADFDWLARFERFSCSERILSRFDDVRDVVLKRF